ncbi:MAG: P-loop NTPase [Deltaproteobacteria bacterium]|nr:P-loop NTPase [Deltaproteobacteria bacterium]
MGCLDLEGFSEVARDHPANPRHYGPLQESDGHARVTGPCGDTMEFWISVQNGLVARASFITDGCASSVACGSMATTLAQGKSVGETAALQQQDILKALEGFPADHEHCALLAVNTLKAACADFLKGREISASDQTADTKSTPCETCGKQDCSASHRRQGESDKDFEERQKLQSRLCRIRHKIVVLSGKGGVGKSTVAVTIATALTMLGKRVGLLDIDIHGPSIPTLLGLEGKPINDSEQGLLPVELGAMKVMSLGFLLKSPDDAVIWRGPMKMGVIKQFLKDTVWGDLDYLIVDSPPGTGDEPLSVCQLIGTLDGAVIVTTPQKVAAVDVRKSITFCRQLKVPILGVVENMSGFVCPKCGEVTQILPSGGGRTIADDMKVPFLGAIPIDPKIAEAGDRGQAFIECYSSTPTAEIMRAVIEPICKLR